MCCLQCKLQKWSCSLPDMGEAGGRLTVLTLNDYTSFQSVPVLDIMTILTFSDVCHFFLCVWIIYIARVCVVSIATQSHVVDNSLAMSWRNILTLDHPYVKIAFRVTQPGWRLRRYFFVSMPFFLFYRTANWHGLHVPVPWLIYVAIVHSSHCRPPVPPNSGKKHTNWVKLKVA